MSSSKIFRFAPSPNGYLHLGHAYSALFTAYWAKKSGARFLLRIEDIDVARCKPEFAEAIEKDLRWLGLDWEGTVLFQSTRFEAYEKAAGQLRDMGVLYPCFCTRAKIASAATKSDPDGAPIYPGTCKELSNLQIEQRLGEKTPVQWRLDMDKALDLTGIVQIRETQPDPLSSMSERNAEPGRWGDVVLVRKDVPTSYHLGVVIDDDFQNITHITRGKDLLAATDVHRTLQTLLGFFSPIYCHHDLIKDDGDMKLAKSKGAPSLKDLREAGWSAKAIISKLGF